MSELKKLEEKHKQEIKELQDNCPHEFLSEKYWYYVEGIGCRDIWVYKNCLHCGRGFVVETMREKSSPPLEISELPREDFQFTDTKR